MAKYSFTDVSTIRRADGAYVPRDVLNSDYQEYLAYTKAGGLTDPYVKPVDVVTSVTPRQARLALLGAGLLDKVEAAVTAAGGPARITWDHAGTIERSDPLMLSLGAALNLTSVQIDALFVTASTL
jgi:hypothetical protein